MDWNKLLSKKRLGKNTEDAEDARSPFQKDFDRIVFSSAFRRLQDKTQVFPLPESDFVRTRLTHSLEVSCIGRSLGTMVGKRIIEKHGLRGIYPIDFGTIVASACLAHDIGNPPFGHSGEDALRNWFHNARVLDDPRLSEKQKHDFLAFEGNAQGFRTLTCLQNANNKGGLQLTYATLGAFAKYPRESIIDSTSSSLPGVSYKKFGFFQSEKKFFEEVANETGLIRRSEDSAWWCRHPLAFLVEAADDICYRIIDFEDGYRLGHVSFRDAKEQLGKIAKGPKVEPRLRNISGEKEQIEYLRATAINALIEQVVRRYIDHEEEMLAGTFDSELISLIPAAESLKEIKETSKQKVYGARNVLEIEAAGFEVISGLLDMFVDALDDISMNGASASPKSKKYAQLLPQRCQESDRYERLLRTTDFVSGMTDSFAVSVYKKMKGISLPDI